MERQRGCVKKWNAERGWGIIFAPKECRYFLHISKVVSGQVEIGCRVTFDIGPRRSVAELEEALNVEVIQAAQIPQGPRTVTKALTAGGTSEDGGGQ